MPDAFSSASRRAGPSSHPLVGFLPWGVISATSLLTKHGDLAGSLPPFLPPGTRGVLVPRAPDRGPGIWSRGSTIQTRQHGKASLAGFIVNQELKKRISREKCSVLGHLDGFWPGSPPGAPWGGYPPPGAPPGDPPLGTPPRGPPPGGAPRGPENGQNPGPAPIDH